MSLLKSIFDAICSKDEPKYPNGNNLDGALKRAEAIRCNMNGLSAKPQKRSSYFADHYGCGIHAVETYNDE